jgi:hypothetical protein
MKKSDDEKPIKVPPRQNLYRVTAGIPGMKRRAYGFKVQAQTPREAGEKAAQLALAISNHRGITPQELSNNRAEAWALEATWYGGQIKVA